MQFTRKPQKPSALARFSVLFGRIQSKVCNVQIYFNKLQKKKAIKVQFREQKGRKKVEKNSAAYDAERPLFLDSFLKLKIRGL